MTESTDRRVTPAEIVARIRARNEARPGAEPNRRAADIIARLRADIARRRAEQDAERGLLSQPPADTSR